MSPGAFWALPGQRRRRRRAGLERLGWRPAHRRRRRQSSACALARSCHEGAEMAPASAMRLVVVRLAASPGAHLRSRIPNMNARSDRHAGSRPPAVWSVGGRAGQALCEGARALRLWPSSSPRASVRAGVPLRAEDRGGIGSLSRRCAWRRRRSRRRGAPVVAPASVHRARSAPRLLLAGRTL